MKGKAIFLSGAAFLLALPLVAKPPRPDQSSPAKIFGDYAEFRNADVYTGPCFANSEEGLTGNDAVLAWHVRAGSWSGVSLADLSVVAVVRAKSTLGDPYFNPYPARTFFIVDQRANSVQRAALVHFAQSQSRGLLQNVVAVEAQPIGFTIARHGFTSVHAGRVLNLSTRTLRSTDMICHNEEVYYPPLAQHLEHSMPVVAEQSRYSGNVLGVNWNESGRRSSFVGMFAE